MVEEEKPKLISIQFELPEEMVSQLDEICKRRGYAARTEFVREAVRMKLDEWKTEIIQEGSI